MEELPLEILEQIASKFPLTNKGLDTLLNYCKVHHICQDEQFWRRLYKEKIDSTAQYPPIGNSWQISYIFFIRHESYIFPPGQYKIFIPDDVNGIFSLATDISGFDIHGKPFFLTNADIIFGYYHDIDDPQYLNIIYKTEDNGTLKKITCKFQVKAKFG